MPETRPIPDGTPCVHGPSGRRVVVLGPFPTSRADDLAYRVRWLDGLAGMRSVYGDCLTPIDAPAPADPEGVLLEASGLVAELSRGLPPGTRLTVSVELPYEREYPHLHDGRDPEADE